MKLRTKAMVILVAAVVLSMVGSGIFFFHHYKVAYRHSMLESVDSVAKSNAKALGNYLQRQKDIAKHIGRLLPLASLELDGALWVEDYFARHYDDFSFFSDGFFFFDANGVLKVDYPPHKEKHGKDYSFLPYFQQTLQEKKGVIGQPYRSYSSWKPVVTFTTYLSSKDGTPLGIMGCSSVLAEDEVFKNILNNKIGKTGYNYVFDTTRLLILHPDPKRMLTRDVAVGRNQMFDAAIAGFEGVAETINSKNIKMLVSYRQVPGTNWIVASQVPAEEALAPLVASQRVFVIFILIGSAVAALVGLFFVHRSMRVLDVLETAVTDLAIPDNLKHGIESALEAETAKLNPLTDHPEFGPLAGTISNLYHRLGRSLAETQQVAGELESAYEQLKSTQSQMLQQEKMASVGQLAAGVAHEINNPMGFISSNLGTLQRYQKKLSSYLNQLEEWLEQNTSTDLVAQQKELKKKDKINFILEDIADLVEESSEGALRVREIVQNLKSFSRVDQKEFFKADLNDCLDSTISIAMNEIKYKATIEKDFGEIPLLSCYPQQLNQVFLNILVNAAQAIKGSGIIKLKTWAEESFVVISISDNGAGIPADIQEKIFDPFFTTKPVGDGTGLGMSISYEIIKKHKGNITVDSQVGQGTTFTIKLPIDLEGENK